MFIVWWNWCEIASKSNSFLSATPSVRAQCYLKVLMVPSPHFIALRPFSIFHSLGVNNGRTVTGGELVFTPNEDTINHTQKMKTQRAKKINKSFGLRYMKQWFRVAFDALLIAVRPQSNFSVSHMLRCIILRLDLNYVLNRFGWHSRKWNVKFSTQNSYDVPLCNYDRCECDESRIFRWQKVPHNFVHYISNAPFPIPFRSLWIVNAQQNKCWKKVHRDVVMLKLADEKFKWTRKEEKILLK